MLVLPGLSPSAYADDIEDPLIHLYFCSCSPRDMQILYENSSAWMCMHAYMQFLLVCALYPIKHRVILVIATIKLFSQNDIEICQRHYIWKALFFSDFEIFMFLEILGMCLIDFLF